MSEKVGIEIHFNEKRGCLELSCEGDDFSPYRELARKQLRDFTGLPFDKVTEIVVVDAAASSARRHARGARLRGLLAGLVVALILILAVVGAYTLISEFNA
jgi:hypothetical protein